MYPAANHACRNSRRGSKHRARAVPRFPVTSRLVSLPRESRLRLRNQNLLVPYQNGTVLRILAMLEEHCGAQTAQRDSTSDGVTQLASSRCAFRDAVVGFVICHRKLQFLRDATRKERRLHHMHTLCDALSKLTSFALVVLRTECIDLPRTCSLQFRSLLPSSTTAIPTLPPHLAGSRSEARPSLSTTFLTRQPP